MKQRTNGLPLSFYVVSLASFLFQLTRHTTQPIFTLYVLDMGASLVQVGLILSIQSTLMMMVRIPLTVVADRIGHNKMFIVAFVIQASTSILYAIAPNPSWLYIIPIYQIIASGSFNQLAMSTASNLAPVNKQGDALGRYMTFMSLGMFVGPVIAGSLMNFINYRQLYLVTSLFPTIGLGLFLMFIQKREYPESLHEIKGEDLSSTLSTLKIILKDRNIVVLTLIRAAYSMSNTVFTNLFTVFAIQDLGFTPALASFLYSVISITKGETFHYCSSLRLIIRMSSS